MPRQIFLIRHGKTDWAELGRHTSRTDIPLNAEGEKEARRLKAKLKGVTFAQVLVSPRQRAQRTCALAGLGSAAVIDPDLAEWDYGEYEGLRSPQILKERPGWKLFRDGCPGGETPVQVRRRADRVLARLRKLKGNVALVSHGHFGRALAARWMELPVSAGQRLLLSPASLSILGYEHHDPEAPVVVQWNTSP